MEHNECKKINNEYIQLQKLKELFDTAFQVMVETGNVKEVKDLQQQIQDKLEIIRGYFSVTIEQANEIMGEDFIGPKEIREIYNVKLEQIPRIPFSVRQLKRAKELGQELILYIDKNDKGEPMNLRNIAHYENGKFPITKNVIYHIDPTGDISESSWFKESELEDQTPELGWRLVTKEVIPNSVGKNHLEQTETLVSYIKNVIFKNQIVPTKYREAIEEFQSNQSKFENLFSERAEMLIQTLANLKITKLVRESCAEAVYRLVIHQIKTGERLLNDNATVTSTVWPGPRNLHDILV